MVSTGRRWPSISTPKTCVADLHLDGQAGVGRDHERRGGPAVDSHGAYGRMPVYWRPAAAHRPPSSTHSSRWRRDRQTVAGQTDIELSVDCDLGDDLAGSATDDHEIVQGPVVWSAGGAYAQGGQGSDRPIAGPEAVERLEELLP